MSEGQSKDDTEIPNQNEALQAQNEDEQDNLFEREKRWWDRADVLKGLLGGLVAGVFALMAAILTGVFAIAGINSENHAQATRVAQEISTQSTRSTEQLHTEISAQATRMVYQFEAQATQMVYEVEAQATQNALNLSLVRAQMDQDIVFEATRTSRAFATIQLTHALEVISDPNSPQPMREFALLIYQSYSEVVLPEYILERIINGDGYIDEIQAPSDYIPGTGGIPIGGTPGNVRMMIGHTLNKLIFYVPFSEDP